jgi:transcriptional regulator with XRE-family HTH domain
LFHGLTPNQVVAYNLAMARDLKGWTQDQAAVAMEPYLGVRWSKASVSQAERSVAGGFVRNFTADEIVAFARTYEVPVTWFFMPPPPVAAPGVPARLMVPDASSFGKSVAMLVDLVFGDRVQQATLALRLEQFLANRSTPGLLTEAQSKITALADQRVAALVHHAFSELGFWQSRLRALANRLEDLEAISKTTLAKDLDIDPGDLRLPPRLIAEASGGWDDDPVAAYLRMLDAEAAGKAGDGKAGGGGDSDGKTSDGGGDAVDGQTGSGVAAAPAPRPANATRKTARTRRKD